MEDFSSKEEKFEQWRYKKYFAFYRVQGNNIEVVRIIMAKRDFMQILFGDAEE